MYLRPISTCTSVGLTATTTPLTLWLEFMLFNDSSSASSNVISSKDFSATVSASVLVSAVTSSAIVSSFFKISVILFSTSLIITAGVEAPAVTPTKRTDLKSAGFNSSAVSIKTVFVLASQISSSFLVFELCLPPMTTIRSVFSANSSASFCLSVVASHIVSKNFAFV